MRECFELRATDAGGRIGELTVPRANVTVETPTLLPVINPNIDTLSPRQLADTFGAEILITNAYIIHSTPAVRERALDEGLHEMFDFPGAIMTDSGSFQLAEYGEITVSTEEILRFQRDIGSDIGTPVDIPTPPDVGRERASEELETTQERLGRAESVDTGAMLVNAPVQGSVYPDLRERAARHADGTAHDVFPVGAVVPLLNEYRYADVVDVVAAAKRGLGEDAPVHLFGAGHPMMFALAVALGCDLFDSAAYALAARDDRYHTVRGTSHLDDLVEFPCACPVCTSHDPASVRALENDDREEALAAHNLHVAFAELRRIKAAIRAGNLLELVEARARGHPRMLEGYRRLVEYADAFERTDPVSKGSFFYLSQESARRPEVIRHHRRLDRLSVPSSLLIAEGNEPPIDDYDEVWRLKPPFGPYPSALSKSYPLTAEVPAEPDESALEAAADGVTALVDSNPDTTFALAHRGWPARVLDRLPTRVEQIDLST